MPVPKKHKKPSGDPLSNYLNSFEDSKSYDNQDQAGLQEEASIESFIRRNSPETFDHRNPSKHQNLMNQTQPNLGYAEQTTYPLKPQIFEGSSSNETSPRRIRLGNKKQPLRALKKVQPKRLNIHTLRDQFNESNIALKLKKPDPDCTNI